MKKWFSEVLKTYFFHYFPLIVVFTASLYVPSDSDMGWHLKYGEFFFKSGHILRENIFSTQMPGFPWVNSSWGIDLITYAVFSRFGFYGLSILGALVITGILFFFAKAAKLSFWEKSFLFPLVLYFEKPLFEVSFRGQLVTLLFIAVLYFLLSLWEQGKKKFLLLAVPLFILWSNLHGQYLLGLGLFFLWSVLYFLKKRAVLKEGISLFLIFFFSFLSTFINPFGAKVFLESLRHFGNPLQRYIVEWIPFERFSFLWWNLIFWDLLILINVGLIYRQKKFRENLHYILPTVLLLVMSFYVRRYAWSMALISIPVVRYIFLITEKSLKVYVSETIATLTFIFIYLFIVLFKVPIESVASMNWDRYCYQYVKCSPPSAQFLRDTKPSGKMMTFYNWGGWLIANYPDIKPSIDGRMHLWKDEKGYSAFEEYYPYEQNWRDIDSSDYNIVYMTTNKPLHQRLDQLVKEGKWKAVYRDDYASIFTRNSPLKKE